MIVDIRTAVNFAAVSLAAATVSYAEVDRWKFELTEEDWGKFCSIFVDLGPKSFFGFHGAPNEAVEAFIKTENDKYPAFFELLVRSENGKSSLMDGEMSDYFGHPTFSMNGNTVSQIVNSGQSALVQLVGGASFQVPLTGFKASLAAFDECLAG